MVQVILTLASISYYGEIRRKFRSEERIEIIGVNECSLVQLDETSNQNDAHPKYHHNLIHDIHFTSGTITVELLALA